MKPVTDNSAARSRGTAPPDPFWDHPAARQWLGRLQRLRALDHARPWLLDGGLAGLVLLLGIGSLRPGAPRDVFDATTTAPVALLVATAVAQALPLVWRRRFPLAVLWPVLAVCIVQVSLGVALRSDVGLMIALYSVARYASLRLRGLIWAGAFTLAALVLALFRVPHLLQQAPFVLFFLACAVTASIALGLAARARQAQLTALADRASRLEIEREQRIELAVAAERTRASRELHDILGHTLAVIIGLADGAARQAAASPERASEVLQIIAGTGRRALGELRLTLGVIRERPPGDTAQAAALSPQPGITDLTGLLDRIRAAGPQVTYRTAGAVAALAPGLQLAVYRIVQEALTNALKHAGPATTVLVSLDASDTRIEVVVEDTGPPAGHRAPGRGDGQQDGQQDGQGLAGIRERAALAGGTAQIGPGPGGGWAVRAVLPAPAGQQPA